MECPRCGAEQDQDNLFCTKCGSKLEVISSTPKTPDQGTEQPLGSSSSKEEEERILQELKEALRVVEEPKTSPLPTASDSVMGKKIWIAGGAVVLVVLLVIALDLVNRSRKGPAPAPPAPIEAVLESAAPSPSLEDEATRTTVGKIAAILEAIKRYTNVKRSLPSSLTSLNRGYGDPESTKDGWEQNILFLVDLTNKTFIIRSLGPDGERETPDDIAVVSENAETWLKEHEQTINVWKTANPNFYAQLVSVGPSLEEIKRLEAARKSEEAKRKQEAEASDKARKQEEEQNRLKAHRFEEEKRKQAEAKKTEEELRQAKAREEEIRRQQAARQAIEFNDSFTDGLVQWDAPSSWEIVKDKELSALRVQGLGFMKKGERWDNYKMEFEIKVNKESAGWVVRAKNASNFYLFKLASDRAKAIPKNSLVKYIYYDGKYLNSLKREDAPGAAGVTPLPFKVRNKDFYRVAVVVKGNTIAHYVDGIQVDSWIENTFDHGRFGFNASIIEMATIRNVAAEPVQ